MTELIGSQAKETKLVDGAPVVVTQEVERKWLVVELPDLTSVKGRDVVQGYIAVASDGTEVRVRQTGDEFFQTIKTDGGLVRGEVEIELSKDQYDALWVATEGRRLEKVRYEIPYQGLTIELDVYKGPLTGLLVAEVEFLSVRDAELFTPPAWFGKEVTNNTSYKNKHLALNGVPVDA
jgi:CYTH domain-containing protein